MDSAIFIYIEEKPNSFGQLSYNELKAKKNTTASARISEKNVNWETAERQCRLIRKSADKH